MISEKKDSFHTKVKYTKNNTVFILNTFHPEVTHFIPKKQERRGTTQMKTIVTLNFTSLPYLSNGVAAGLDKTNKISTTCLSSVKSSHVREYVI